MLRKTYTGARLLAAAAVCVTALACVTSASEKRTLKRTMDPVIVTGAQLAPVKGRRIADMRLYASNNGKFMPVPYQIDERDKNDAYVFSGKKDNDNSSLDANDELVFMASDAGDRAAKKAWPKGTASGVEITVTDPVDGGKAWAYLLVFKKGHVTQPSKIDYVKCLNGDREIDAANYYLRFAKNAPIAFDRLTIKKAGGGPGRDVLDRLKIRFHAETMVGITVDRNEEEFTADLIGVIDGPVRVIRSTSNRMILFGKLPTPSAVSEQIFYNALFEFPIIINVPVNLDMFLKNTWLRVTSESEFPNDTIFYNENNMSPVAIDGVMTPAEKSLNLGSYDWQVVAGNAPPNTGAWVNRLLFDRKKTPASVRLYYMDDANVKDPPEEKPGQIGNLGYQIKDVERLGAGQHLLRTYMYNLKSYKPGQETQALNILDKPLKVSVSK